VKPSSVRVRVRERREAHQVEDQLAREHDLAQERLGRQDRNEMPQLLEKEIGDPPAGAGTPVSREARS
jgi:hypothetical protein